MARSAPVVPRIRRNDPPPGRPAAAPLFRGLAGALLLVWAFQVPQEPHGRASEPVVLGVKITRCTAGATQVTSGTRLLAAQNGPLTFGVSRGRLGAILAPPLRVDPSGGPASPYASFTLAVAPSAPGTVAVSATVRNRSTCAIALTLGRVELERGASPPLVASLAFGGRDRVVVPAGGRATGRAVLPVAGDGTYAATGTVYAEVGAER